MLESLTDIDLAIAAMFVAMVISIAVAVVVIAYLSKK